MEFDLIITICPVDKQDAALDAAREAGATGSTIMIARGAGAREAKTFFGLTLERQQEAILTLVNHANRDSIMEAIYKAADMIHPGNGICISLSVNRVMGLESQLSMLSERETGKDKD